jgi:hypothetical protein
VQVGDYLLAIGDIAVTAGFGERFRARYGRAEGQTMDIRVRRGSETLSLPLAVQFSVRTERQLMFVRTAPARAAVVRHGILTGITNRR